MGTLPMNKESPGWRVLKSWLLTQIHNDQRQLELPTLDERLHQVTRGRIAAWRQLINEVEPGVQPELPEPEEYIST